MFEHTYHNITAYKTVFLKMNPRISNMKLLKLKIIILIHIMCISILIRSNKVLQYAGIYLLQNYSTCFGYLSHPSAGVHKNVTAASGTGHITCQRDVIGPRWRKDVALTRDMTCFRSCSYSFMYSC